MKQYPANESGSFLPKQKRFWAYHGSGLGLLSIVQALIILQRNQLVAFDFIAHNLWCLLFTLAMLGLRWVYKKYSWGAMRTIKLIPSIILANMVASISIVVVMFGLLLPFYLPELLEHTRHYEPEITANGLTIKAVIGNFLQSMLFTLIWAFIYISDSYLRRAKEAEFRALRYENSLKEAQLANLAGQLNPHFLFNALNNIRFLIHESAERADNALTTLSEVLRHSLKTNASEKITLQQEMEFIQKYLEIAALQLEHRLMAKVQVSAQVEGCLVPPLLLQMLVENAIKHGIDQLPEPGLLDIQINPTQDARLAIQVVNDKPEQESQLVAKLGIGLNNIRSRLQLMYGNDAELEIQHDTRTFAVNITLPMEFSA